MWNWEYVVEISDLHRVVATDLRFFDLDLAIYSLEEFDSGWGYKYLLYEIVSKGRIDIRTVVNR